MSARYLGSFTIGGVIPGAAVVASAGMAGINVSLGDMQSKLTGLQSWKPGNISIASQISQLEAMITALNSQLALGVDPPSLATQLAGLADLIAELQVSVTALNTQASIIGAFQTLLLAAGVHLVQYTGRADRLGPEVGDVLANAPGVAPGQHMDALALSTSYPDVWTSIGKIFRVAK